MKPRLSILIPTVNGRETMLDNVVARIESLSAGLPVEILPLKTKHVKHGGESIGDKRNKLRHMAAGDYIAFVDDDDMISDLYMTRTFEMIDENLDVLMLVGLMTTNGHSGKRFEHSIMYDHYFENGGVYYRPPNHLNPMRKDLAMTVDFPSINMGEDTNFAMNLCRSAKLNSEKYCTDVIYYYNYVPNKGY